MGTKDRLRAAVVAGLLLTGFPSALAQSWTLTSAPLTNWSSIAMSADGSKMVATVHRGLIYNSTNFGVSWLPTPAFEQTWTAIASSADGANLAVAAIHLWSIGGIWISTNSGFNWSMTWALTNNWKEIETSADGNVIVAVDSGVYRYPGRVAVSTNAGQSWMYPFSVDAPEQLTSVAVSSDGMRCVASSTQQIYSSDDAGQTWIATDAPAGIYTGVACSSDGRRWAAVAHNGEIRVSPDFGTNWTLANSPNFAWQSVASSSDGSKLVAISTNGPIYSSTNSGSSWFPSSAPALQWQSVASSADGSKRAVVAHGGGIYTWQTTPSPKLDITLAGSGLLISWVVPSMPFVLQEAADLNAADWTDVTTQPTLNLTNLHHQVSVPLSSSNRFHRLVSL